MTDLIKLYIGSELASLGDASTAVLFNYKMTDTENPSIIRNSYTKSITLPRDQVNEAIFGHMGRLDRTQLYTGNSTGPAFNPSYKTDFTLMIDGEIYQTGYLKLDKVNKDGFTCTLFGGLGDFFAALTYKNDDTENDKKSLADLIYSEDGKDTELDFNITADAVNSRWETFTSSTPSNRSLLTFVPCYDGLPDGMDTEKVLINTDSDDLAGIELTKVKEGKTYSAKDGWILAELPGGQVTSLEARDLRSWTLRPAIKLSRVMEACFDERNNGGYEVNIDSAFTQTPYWQDTYITLPRLTEIDWEGDKSSTDRQANVSLSDSAYTTRVQTNDVTIQGNDTLYFGGSDSNTRLNFYITFSGNSATTSENMLYTSANRWESNHYDRIMETVYSSLFVQMLAYSGNTVVAASPTVELTSKVPDRPAYSRGEEKSYTTGNNDLYGKYDPSYKYTPDEHNTEIQRSFGYFKNNGSNVFSWNEPIQLEIDKSQTFTRLAIRITRCAYRELRGRTQNPSNYFFKVYSQASVSRSDLGMGKALDAQVKTTGLYNPSVTFSYGSKVRSGTHITKQKLLTGEHTPAEYLISLAKIFDLKFYKHKDEKVIDILTRDNFFINTRKDISEVIDIESFEMVPLTFDTKWLDFKLESIESRYTDDYNSTSQAGYGTRRVNTGYNFNGDARNVLEGNVFRTAVECLDRSRLYTQVDGTVLPGYFAGGITYNLWNGDESIEENFDITVKRNCFDDGQYYDISSKMQFQDASLNGTDGKDVIVFFTGWKGGMDQTGKKVYWMVTDDLKEMIDLNEGNPCWMYSEKSTDGEGRRLCYRYWQIPGFGRFLTSGNGITYSLEMGMPRQLYFPNYIGKDEAAIYDRYWKDYVADMYDIDTRKVTAMVRFREKPTEDTMRKFYWFQNSNWRINSITDYNPLTNDLTKVELIKVNDISNYTTNPEPAPIEPVVPHLRVFSPMSSINQTGDTVCIGVDANMSWSATASTGTLDISSGTGSEYINLTVGKYWDTGATEDTRTITVNFEGVMSGFSTSISFVQELWKPSVEVVPHGVMLSYTGGTITADWNCTNMADAPFDMMPPQQTGVVDRMVITYDEITADTDYHYIQHIGISENTGTTVTGAYWRGGLFRSAQSQPFFYADDTLQVIQFPSEIVFEDDGYEAYLGAPNETIISIPIWGIKVVAYPSWVMYNDTEAMQEVYGVSVSYPDFQHTVIRFHCAQNGYQERIGDMVLWKSGINQVVFNVRQLGQVFLNPARRGRQLRSGVYPRTEELCYTADEQSLRVDVEDLSPADSTPWSIETDDEWITLDRSGGTGSGYFIVTVAENETGEPRNAYIDFHSPTEDSLVIVHQSEVYGGGGSKVLSINPKKLDLSYESASTSITVNCIQGGWTASTSDSWIIFQVPSGSTGGSQTFNLAVSENSGSTPRIGTIIFHGDFNDVVLTINQGIFEIELSVSPSSLTYDYTGGTENITITTNTDWNIS